MQCNSYSNIEERMEKLARPKILIFYVIKHLFHLELNFNEMKNSQRKTSWSGGNSRSDKFIILILVIIKNDDIKNQDSECNYRLEVFTV